MMYNQIDIMARANPASRRARLLFLSAVILATVAIAASLSLLATDRFREIILPVVVLTGTLAFVGLVSAYLDDDFPVDDIGLWIAAVTWLYGTLPALTYIALGYQFSPFSDNRLKYVAGDFVGVVCWYYAVFLLSFGCCYLLIRRRPAQLLAEVKRPANSRIISIVAIAIGVWMFMQSIALIYGLNTETYIESYRAAAAMPLVVRQLYNLANGIQLVVLIGVLVLLFSNWPRWWPIIVVWMAIHFAIILVILGARTGLMILLAASIVLFHRFVRRISIPRAICIAIVGMALFLTLGVLREIDSLQTGGRLAAPTAGEFENLFTNSLDLLSRERSGDLGRVPLSVYAYDFVGFIPSQLLPIEKQDPATWYLQEFYPEYGEAGGGLAFGAIAQAVIGFGLIEVAARGAALGVLCGLIFRAYRRHAYQFWVSVGYLWLLVLCYQPIRASTLIWVIYIIQQLVPAMAIVLGTGWLLRQALGRTSVRRPADGSAAHA